MNIKTIAFLIFCGVTVSCTVPQQVVLAPVTVTENLTNNVYRGSYPQTTDILHTKLDLNFNWDSAYVYGKATITAKPYFYPQNQVILNANGFQIKAVELLHDGNQIPLKYAYDNKLLTITLDKQYNSSQKFDLYISYVAMPYKLKIGTDIASAGDRGLYFINRDGKQKGVPKQLWTQGETECNSNWFPTINGPQEKMTQEISLTVPDKFVTLSNGVLDFSSLNGDGTHTDVWRQMLPHSTYLTMIAVGEFAIVRDKWREKDVNYYMEPAFAPQAKLIFGKTPEMMEFFSNKTGIDFVWDKYSQIVVREFVSGAMENTTATTFFDRMNMTEGEYLDENYESIIAHELFHHWFGDLVTAESWANLPLNESFATYGEYLWNEFKYGRDYADLYGMKDQAVYLQNVRSKQADVIRFDYADREQMFDDVTYQKGGRILHMLRNIVGDYAFFNSLNLYLTEHKYKTAEIHDLRLAFEEVTGQDLNWFFKEWFLASGHPVLDINTTYDALKKLVTVTIKQNQDIKKTPLYKMPLAIDIYINGNKDRKAVFMDDKKEQSFSFPYASEPELVNVDAEKMLLAEKTENKTLKQYIYQYKNAPLFLDRMEAVIKFKENKDLLETHPVMISALNDQNWLIRQFAVEFTENYNDVERKQVSQKLQEMSLSDPRSYVRAAAITALAKYYPFAANKDIFSKAASDKSPSVLKALEATR